MSFDVEKYRSAVDALLVCDFQGAHDLTEKCEEGEFLEVHAVALFLLCRGEEARSLLRELPTSQLVCACVDYLEGQHKCCLEWLDAFHGFDDPGPYQDAMAHYLAGLCHTALGNLDKGKQHSLAYIQFATEHQMSVRMPYFLDVLYSFRQQADV